jgi:hypothetical protein
VVSLAAQAANSVFRSAVARHGERLSVFSREAGDEALQLFYKSIEIDPNYAVAYGRAGEC